MTSIASARRTGRAGRTAAVWAGIAVVVLALGAAVGAISADRGAPDRAPLDPEGPAPDGARAVAGILADRGVDITFARSLGDARAALDGAGTLVLADTGVLDDDVLVELADSATTTVLLQPRARDLRVLFDDARSAGRADATVAPDCRMPAAQRAGDVTVGAVYAPAPGAVACYPVGDGWGLVQSVDGARTAVDAAALMSNATLAEEGNAALMLGLLGGNRDLVWYLPAAGDGAGGGAATLGELTPPWVTPSVVVLVAAAVAAAVWRGRRFGPLVVEDLPVTVRAAETTEGRGRLYARAGDTAHAAERLRTATARRLASRLGLGAGAPPADVAAAVAARTGVDARAAYDLLAGPAPTDDRALLSLADALRDLERTLDDTAASRPERKTDT